MYWYSIWSVSLFICDIYNPGSTCFIRIPLYSNTFTKVEEENDVYWKYLRYQLAKEYFNRPELAPPFIIFIHVYRMIRYVLDRKHILGWGFSSMGRWFMLSLWPLPPYLGALSFIWFARYRMSQKKNAIVTRPPFCKMLNDFFFFFFFWI